MELKKTKEQIINALKSMVWGHIPSADCEEDAVNYCVSEIAKDTLALINQLSEKNEKLEKLLDDKCDRCIERERADTVRKMQERLYPLYEVLCVDEGDWRNEVDKIAKEMLKR